MKRKLKGHLILNISLNYCTKTFPCAIVLFHKDRLEENCP